MLSVFSKPLVKLPTDSKTAPGTFPVLLLLEFTQNSINPRITGEIMQFEQILKLVCNKGQNQNKTRK